MQNRLIELVTEQFGDAEYFKECVSDIASYGADAGWSGFSYHGDTVPFGEKIRSYVRPMLAEYSDIGEFIPVLKGFRCLDGWTMQEIVDGWYSNEDEQAHTAVMNAIAWFALEEVARYIVDQRDEVTE